MAETHRRAGRRSWMLGAALALVVCSLIVASADGFDFDSDAKRTGATVLDVGRLGRNATVIEVGSRPVSRPIAPGFIGLSLEYPTLERYAGRTPERLDPVLVRLIRGLAPGQRPVLRIGGDSTDWTWWPVPHVARPLGIRIAIGPGFASVLHALAEAVDARLILGIDLEADSRRIAAVEATQLVRRVGPRWVSALELGNEPELYGSWPWRIMPSGRRVIGRAAGYGMAAYTRDFASIASALPRDPLAGPALGGPLWIHHVGEFISAEPRVRLLTLHTYPLQACDTPLIKPTYPTIPHLLARPAGEGLADGLAATVRLARARGLPLRVDEINSASCGGKLGVSNTFASALWALNTLFALARTGVEGVNVHTFQTAAYGLFRLRRGHGGWRGTVAPEYYGLLLFGQAAPPGSRLLSVHGGGQGLRTWASRARDGTLRVVLINQTERPRLVLVHAPVSPPLAGYEALRAPGLRATAKVSLGGRSFGETTGTGSLPMAVRLVVPVQSQSGAYAVRLPAASAVMLTLPAGGWIRNTTGG